MSRLYQVTLIVSILGLSWLGMQITHELGHVCFAWLGDERIERVVLHPLVISRTDTTHNRDPLLVIWGGPILGTLLPLAALSLARLSRCNLFYLFQFFAGFCLVANGTYLGVGSFYGIGDAGELLHYGAPRWTLISFGLICGPTGLSLWNGLGTNFGLRRPGGEVSRRAALGTLGLLVIVVSLEILAGNR